MFGFSIVAQVFSMIIFLMVITIFVVVIASNLKEKRNNDRSPKLCVPARVVAKREQVRHHHHGMGDAAGSDMTTWSTTYYVTFEFESSDRAELHVPGSEYGMLAEGDYGKLTFQGTRYLDFTRE